MRSTLAECDEAVIEQLAFTLVDQDAAQVIVPANKPTSGFWFGGGNMIEDSSGHLFLVGRYRNQGESRTGLHKGERGLELALFRSDEGGHSFEKIACWSKAELNVGEREVLSIEGSALHRREQSVELFGSTEKTNIAYPSGLESFQKSGTGVWTIDHLQADAIEGLKDAEVRTILQGDDPQFTHVKDPFVYERDGDLVLMFCTHPFNWSSSNTAYTMRMAGQKEFSEPSFEFFPRGFTWDVAITRGTCVVDVPKVGAFSDRDVSLMFYDGGESLRNLQEHTSAVTRPRGYSREEIGGAAYVVDGKCREIKRLSRTLPWFVRPHGTGCSRYVDVHRSHDGYFVTWQQSQPDLSQPLVMNFVSHERVISLLA